MSWLNKVSEDIGNIVPSLDYFTRELQDAKKEVRLTGNLEKASAAMPGLIEYRFNQLQEIEAMLEYLNISLRKCRSKFYRKYLEGYNRALSSRDVEKYIDGEDEIVALNELVNEVAFVRNQYLGIMKALDNKQWQITNIVKLRTAGMEDINLG